MTLSAQTHLFGDDGHSKPPMEHGSEWGTFKDSLKAPIHGWFTYPAGFSYKAVEHSLAIHSVTPGGVVYDPFMGTGTTNVVAKKLGFSSFGVEAHPFVYWVARTKMNWSITGAHAEHALYEVSEQFKSRKKKFTGDPESAILAAFPELVLKCFDSTVLFDLLILRDSIDEAGLSDELNDLLSLGLTALLRQVANVATGWPYIAPKKAKGPASPKPVLIEFTKRIRRMIEDIQLTILSADRNWKARQHTLLEGDSRDTSSRIPGNTADHIFTSPPYLNNFDYADRTRMELYFFGEARTWGDITRLVRTKLITSATTQINRNDTRYDISSDISDVSPTIYSFLTDSVHELAERRLQRGGKKSYDLMVSGYFNDLFRVLRDCHRILKKGRKAVFVLGDSAPYGVHIPTDELIGKLGVSLGFDSYSIDLLRERGGKWKQNPQRHGVLLRESIVTLTK